MSLVMAPFRAFRMVARAPEPRGSRKFSRQESGTRRTRRQVKQLTSMEHIDIQYSVAMIGDRWR
jgi:hypothetical protein